MNNREALYRAAISCRHEITHDQIILYVDSRKEGNALSQLADRLEQAALASQAQQPTEMNPYGYAVEEADGEVKFFSTFDRPAESYAFKVKTRKVVPLYKQPPAPEGEKS